jgi:ADP-ribosylglycohydrolase
MADQQHERLNRARVALEGLSVGDAFGSFFEFNTETVRLIEERKLPPTPWSYTDDTNMALSVYENLRLHGAVDQDALAASYVAHFDAERNYGVGVRQMLTRMSNGEGWQTVAKEMFFGEGSFGNDAAMHTALIGAYFADDLDKVIEQAKRAAEVTHTHPQGIAGAIAVAVAAACVWDASKPDLIAAVLPHVPAGEVRDGIQRAYELPSGTTAQTAAEALGNGSRASVQDTVPFVLWCAKEHMGNYEEAIWQAASALGDVDTICAMVGGIIVAHTGTTGIPDEWRQYREALPRWALGQ